MFQIASFKIICTDSTKILVFTDFTEIFFSKLGSAGLKYHLPKLRFFTDPNCAGVSYKHCLLTFFIVHTDYMVWMKNSIVPNQLASLETR